MNEELLKEFEKKFEELRKEMGFKSTLEEIEKIFFIKDCVQEKGYISTAMSRTLCSRIVDLYMRWYGYLHDLLMPNPTSMISVTEGHLFDEEDKNEIMHIMNQIMVITSTNNLIGLTKNKKQEAEFIDQAVKTWNDLQPKITSIMDKVNKCWIQNEKNKPRARRPEQHYG